MINAILEFCHMAVCVCGREGRDLGMDTCTAQAVVYFAQLTVRFGKFVGKDTQYRVCFKDSNEGPEVGRICLESRLE